MNRILEEIDRLSHNGRRLIIAVDGWCAAGKTTLANELSRAVGCTVVHMDDFFLRAEQRTAARYSEVGGNVDRERFLSEVLLPLRAGEAFSYRPFDCRAMALGEPIWIEPAAITVVEGTYSCHPALWQYYDLRVFLSTTAEKQRSRLASRGCDLETFLNKWIPLEHRYFSAFGIAEKCDICIET